MILFEKIIVNTQIVTLFPHYGKLPHFSLNYHILCFQKNVQKFLFPKKKLPNSLSKTGTILQFLEYKFSFKILFLIFRIVFNNTPSTLCTFFSSKCIHSYILISEQFNDNISLHNKVSNICILQFYWWFCC